MLYISSKQSGYFLPTKFTFVSVEVVIYDAKSLAANNNFTAVWAIGRFGFVTGNVAEIDEMQSLRFANLPGGFESLEWSRWKVFQQVLGIETGEVERDVGSKVVFDPYRQLPEFIFFLSHHL